MTVVKNTIKEQVYREIKSRILNQVYLPGTFLNIVHLSKEFEVSNSPIREALAMLEKEELVSLASNSKFKVTELDDARVQELCVALATLLSGAVMLTDGQRRLGLLEEQLAKRLEAQISLSADTPQEIRYKVALDFDRTIVTVTENGLLIKAFDNWYNLLLLTTSLLEDISRVSIQEHQQILDAVRKRDVRGILLTLEHHYNKHL